MSERDTALSETETHALRASKELKSHLTVLETLASPALGVLAVASGIYTYLGVSTLLEDNGACKTHSNNVPQKRLLHSAVVAE